jgi:phage gp46-like protein
MIRIVSIEDTAEPYRAPDLGWHGIVGDLILNALDHPTAPGDFRAGQGLATQILIHLMTDRRVEESELRHGTSNRGWLGDSFDIQDGEGPLGSRLWLLRRTAITDETAVLVEDYVREALQPLIDQEAIASLDVTVTVDKPANRVEYVVNTYGRDGTRSFDQKFQLFWEQINGVANPLAR